MTKSIVIPLSMIVAVFAFQPHASAQTAPSDDAASLVAGSSGEPIAAHGGGHLAKQSKRNQQEASVDGGAADHAANGSGEALIRIDVVPSDEAEVERICEFKQRPGSRMARKVCYSREQQLAMQAAREEALKDQLADLEREQRWRDELIREAQMHGRRPSGFGLGPN